MLLSSKHKSFTLIEMLIVIVIIGILAAALIPRLNSLQARARDTTRRTDTLTIYNALMSYQLNNGYILDPAQYWENDSPNGTYGNGDFSYMSGFLTFLVSWGILTSVPVDPINSTSQNTYLYRCALPSSVNAGVLFRVTFETLSATSLIHGFYYPWTGGNYWIWATSNGAQLKEFICA